MVTAKQVFDQAMVLIDEVLENGDIAPDQPAYYKTKALSILTTLQTELLPLSINPEIITEFEQPLLVTDRVALEVLPYGLAAHLLITDDITTAAFFNDRYDELKKRKQSAIIPIVDKYNVTSGMRG
ncbi:hypothetical protein [Heyndrickxia oleronia]|uniref:hypothetical protein n=1 Tax=Heyndrickxia oleronia TaxID=38875 RepID=UPI001B27A4BB|nr:hypothetical protein [Heyndrickxia oleronia]GIN38379.1 hypothetical protein J19TS1_13280 [Heyndrickxia oleronia]